MLGDNDLLFPFEFYLTGTPLSSQASAVSKERWKNEVREAARRRVQESVEWAYLDEGPVALAIYYFPTTPMVGDIDNIVKPIMDALTGVAYLDDQLVERVVAQRFEPGQDGPSSSRANSSRRRWVRSRLQTAPRPLYMSEPTTI